MSDIAKYPDPQGMIARVRSRLPKDCSVRKSQYCDYVIAQRLQGIPYHAIEKWLGEKGKEHRIPQATLWRNFRATKIRIELPYAEELAEQWGGSIDMDLARELTRQILTQRRRVDHMVVQEAKKRDQAPLYTNRLIRAEMETLNNLIANLHKMMKSPMEAAEERAKAAGLLKKVTGEMDMTEEGENALVEMILSGALKLGGTDEGSPSKPS
jgi:hypothetical protein